MDQNPVGTSSKRADSGPSRPSATVSSLKSGSELPSNELGQLGSGWMPEPGAHIHQYEIIRGLRSQPSMPTC